MHVGFRCSERSKAPRSSTGCKNGLSPSSLKIVWSLILYGVFCCILNTFEKNFISQTPQGLYLDNDPSMLIFCFLLIFFLRSFVQIPDADDFSTGAFWWISPWNHLFGGGSKPCGHKRRREALGKNTYTGCPKKNGTVDTVDFWGLCSNQQLSLFTLLDIASFPHYNNTKIIKFGWELFILWVISYGLSFSGFAWFPEFRGTINDKLNKWQIPKMTVHKKLLIQ